MESPTDPVGALREHERAAALPYIEYPPTPAWYPPAVGAWAALFLACFLYLFREPAFLFCMAGLLALEGGFFTWYRRKRGTMPSLRQAPLEFNHAFRLYFGGLAVVLTVIAAAVLMLPRPVAVLTCLVLVTLGLTAYERVYRRAADATRARLR